LCQLYFTGKKRKSKPLHVKDVKKAKDNKKSKLVSAVDTVKRKFSFSYNETSTSTSSDGSSLDNLTIRSDAKKKKM